MTANDRGKSFVETVVGATVILKGSKHVLFHNCYHRRSAQLFFLKFGFTESLFQTLLSFSCKLHIFLSLFLNLFHHSGRWKGKYTDFWELLTDRTDACDVPKEETHLCGDSWR